MPPLPKGEEFLDGQRTYAKTILEKRQAELRELMEKNIAFKAEATRLLQQAENDAYAPLKAKINEDRRSSSADFLPCGVPCHSRERHCAREQSYCHQSYRETDDCSG